jgi:hypothetical protein
MEVSGQLHTPGGFTPGERGPGTYSIEGLVGNRAGLDSGEENIFLPPVVNRTPTVQLVARSYTESSWLIVIETSD